MPRGILITGGLSPSINSIKSIIRDTDIICAADSGLDTALAASITPHTVVGDFDSISDISLLDKFPGETVQTHPTDKDETDTDIGLTWLTSQHCKPLVLLGGGEGRIDHTAAILKLFSHTNAPEFWYTALEEIQFIYRPAQFTGTINHQISIIPVGKGPWSIQSRGLHWPLEAVNWTESLSLSNRFSKKTVELHPIQGKFLSVRPLDQALVSAQQGTIQ